MQNKDDGDMKHVDNKEINRRIGERIRYFRKKKGLSQSEIAAALAVSPSVISTLESGKSMVGIYSLLDIISMLDVGVEDVFPEYSRTYGDGTTGGGWKRFYDSMKPYSLSERERILDALGDLTRAVSQETAPGAAESSGD